MKREELIKKYIASGDLPLDVAGQVAMLGDKAIKRALDKGEIALDVAGMLLSLN